MTNDDSPRQHAQGPGRGRVPMDDLGKAITEGREAAQYLWQVPNDEKMRARLAELLEAIAARSTKQGRREMPRICQELLVAARATPSPQQVDLLQDGFDRLHKLWSAAQSGLL